MQGLTEQAQAIIEHWPWLAKLATPYAIPLSLIVIFGCAWASFIILDKLVFALVLRLVKRSQSLWDDVLTEQGFLHRLAHLAPALTIGLLSKSLLSADTVTLQVLQKISTLYVIVAVVGALSALLNTFEALYNQSPLARRAPITGFIQVGKLVLIVVALLLAVAGLMDKSPLILLSGLGAMTAVLMLIFRDTILGFVAGIQIAANRMVNNRDWIELPNYGVDGEIVALGLTTVKVRNWDNTISTLPTYKLITDAVKNWRGMQESGGRRIKRAIALDQQSIGFMTDDAMDHLSQLAVLKPYLEQKRSELNDYASGKGLNPDDVLNRRRLTNIGTFRAYVKAYLLSRDDIRQDMTLMVRQLAPSNTGVGIELYCFTNTVAWTEYEGIMADIFDHLLAILPEFGLRPYQHISDGHGLLPQA